MRTSAYAIATVALAVGLAAQEKKTDESKSVAGTWNIEMMSHQVALVLEQEGAKVTGTLMMMGNDIPLKGDFVDSKLTLVGVKSEATDEANRNPDDGRGGNQHAQMGSEARPITATLMEDDTLAGEMQTNRGLVKWTGERLKKRK
ncbi:MAG: hypothetical protein ACRD2N_07280 [Vicinamibacterales bacterium]